MSLHKEFEEKIKPELKKELGVKSIAAVPQIKKIVVNMGIGKMRDNKTFVQEALADMQSISGQKPSPRNSRVAISNFKLRQGQMIGIAVTLRGKRMWDFYEKLVKIVMPRIKDFQGVNPKSFDGNGNYSIGLREHIVFPEIDPNKANHSKTLQVTISTSAFNDDNAYKLLKALGMPFRK